MQYFLYFFIYLITYVSLNTELKKNQELNLSNQNNDSIIINGSERIKELNNTLPDDFIITKNKYFIIVSNLSGSETGQIIDNTISSAFECFYNDYFVTKPDEYTLIYLFKDDQSYRKWAHQLYGDEDLSRFGYYKPDSKAMLMNISTGTGTLVHEMTHALVRYDFPEIPTWFNEGLGSLYERCSLTDRNILGYVNWRLPILHKAVNENNYPTLYDLLNTTNGEFYGVNSDVHYAEARYLCLYLQEKNKLKEFYRKFRDTFEQDSTGRTQLTQVLQKDLNVIERDYIIWVKTLKYNQ